MDRSNGAPSSPPAPSSSRRGWTGAVVAAGFALFKWGKLLLAHLGKAFGLLKFLQFGKLAGTLVSMSLSLGVYAMVWGWQFGLGFVLILLVHEYGHVAFARWRGVPVSGPVFIPMFGAFISMKQRPRTVEDEAWLAAGGPVGGLAATTLCWLIGAATGHPLWYALAHIGFFLHMFNLLPVSPLDGGRMVSAISRQIWLVTAPLLLFLGFWQGGIIAFVILWFGWRQFVNPEPAEYHSITPTARWRIGVIYLALVAYSFLGQSAVGVVLGRHGLTGGWEEGWLPAGEAAVATTVVYGLMLGWWWWRSRRTGPADPGAGQGPGADPAENGPRTRTAREILDKLG